MQKDQLSHNPDKKDHAQRTTILAPRHLTQQNKPDSKYANSAIGLAEGFRYSS